MSELQIIPPPDRDADAAFIADCLAREAKRATEPAPEPVKPVEFAVTETRAPAICVKCGQGFMAITMSAANIRPITKQVCDPCVFAREAAERAPALSQGASDAWAGLCEPEFRTVDEGGATVIARLHRDCPKLAEVTAWQFGPKGLLIRGSTGKCKTRAVWRLLREQFDAGRSIVALSSGRFAREYADAAGNHTQSAWFDHIAEADIFFLDDLGKKPWTENAWGEFFELIDERAKNHQPFIITTNETGETMQAKCKDPVTWGPLNRRLKESCTLVTL